MTEDEDRIAIVGLACRVPGAPDARTFWHNLCEGVDSVRRRRSLDFTPDWVSAFGYLDGLTDFDAGLFGYSDSEAALLDPQHRIFLEVAWWALEDAGYDPARSEAQIGVYAGCGANRYLRHHLLGNPAIELPYGQAEDWDDLLAGGTSDYLPMRAAHALGLSGPAVAIQTACSSSLVAVCVAAQALREYSCDLAIAGGAAVVSTRQTGYRYRPGGTLSADGYCRPYDVDATGQVFGNGAGVVVLKRLAEAIEDEDHIYAVLAGWAVNNDGADRAGFLVPGVSGQAAVVAEALASAGWDAPDVSYVEGHGSGTPVGDAIEVDALTRAFRAAAWRPGSAGAVLGSLKGNTGNLDAAAGVVGLIKTAYAVRHGVIPGTLHFRKAHPDVDLQSSPFSVQAETVEFSGPRRAGVSSYGLGGTNAHILVEAAPSRRVQPDEGGAYPLPLSAMDDAALRQLATGLAGYLRSEPDISLADVSYTLSTGRRQLPYRIDVTARSVDEAVASLTSLSNKDAVPVPPREGRRIPLPGYPFQRRRHWIEPIR